MELQVHRGGVSFNVIAEAGIEFHYWERFQTDWEPETFRLLDGIIFDDSVVLDIGGYIGPIAFYAARKCRKVTSFEPDPVAFSRFARNLAANPDITNLTIEESAISTADGEIDLFPMEKGFGFGISASSLLQGDAAPVKVRTRDVLSPDIAQLVRNADLVKIDIEGGEYELIPYMAGLLEEVRPNLYLSLHGERLRPSGTPLARYARRMTQQLRLLESLSFYRNFFFWTNGEWTRLEPVATFQVLFGQTSELGISIYLTDGGRWPLPGPG
jgi:FkbM family methyltransferase